MSRRDMKNYNTYWGHNLKIENEPEEGEIVDEYDLIISSDEELSMRQRIRELEAENEEIEQIAVISRSYVDKINNSRAAQVPTDVSSISSTEFVTPKKRKRQRSRERKRKHYHHQHQHQHEQYHQHKQYLRYELQQIPLKTRLKRSHCKRREKLLAKRQKQFHSNRFIQKEVDVEAFQLESSESFGSSSELTDAEISIYNKLPFKNKNTVISQKYVTRDTLRLAVARNTNYSGIQKFQKSCLKDKLLRRDTNEQPSNSAIIKPSVPAEINVTNDDDGDDDVQIIENEPDIQIVGEESEDSMEEKELRLIALKSAVLKKHMARKTRNADVAYSPTDFDEILCQDNKLNDIDVADLEADDSQTLSPETSPKLMMSDDQDESLQLVDCKPVDMDIANSDSEDATIAGWSKNVEPCFTKFSLDSHAFIHNQYGLYLRELNELPPPPPGVDDYENVPTAPPYNILYDAESQDMELDNEELATGQHQINEEIRINLEEPMPKHSHKTEEDVEDKEEEEALRALLLAKLQSPKTQRKAKKRNESIECQESSSNNCVYENTNLKSKPTEIILKEAVKRLKINSQPESHDDLYSKSITCVDEKENSEKKFKISQTKCKNIPTSINESSNESLFEKNYVQQPVASCNNTRSEQTIIANTSEAAIAIDISDITRRLQKIKEIVLNSNQKLPKQNDMPNTNLSPHIVPNESFEVVENDVKFSQSSFLANKELQSELIPIKTAKLNIEGASIQSTNHSSLKLEGNLPTNTFIDFSCKEHKANNDSTDLTISTKENVELNSDKSVKNTERITESSRANNVQAPKTLTIPKPTSKYIKVPPKATYSSLRTTKIVKPNKVINATFDLNLRQNSQTIVQKPLKPEPISQLSKVSDNTRLITSMDQVKQMCTIAPIVISVQNSSNESSGDDELGESYNCIYKPLYEYNDNTSPLSLNLESPSRTPLRSNSPIEPTTEGSTKHTDLEAFNLKTSKPVGHHRNATNKINLQTKITVQDEKNNKTALAVRHLPAEAQSEYRKLVRRMKMLENKRKLSNLQENEIESSTNKKNGCNLSTTEDSKSDINSSLVKTVLLRNANNNSTTATINTTDEQISNRSSDSTKLPKENVLRSYENLYTKFGAGIVNNLDKSLKLVEEVKHAKIAKLKLENRIKELKAEMDILQTKHKEEQQKISRIYPSICATNEVITTLKQKRSKVFKAALKLGKTMKGEIYRLNNDLKESINSKSKKLDAEIKIVNSLRIQNITNTGDLIFANNTATNKQATNKKEKVEDCRIKCNEESLKLKSNSNTDTSSSANGKQEEENNSFQSPLNEKVGGNKENLDVCNSINRDTTAETSLLDADSGLNHVPSQKDSIESSSSLPSYISPLDHLRNIDSNVDPNGVVCPYDLMGNCEDVTCKYVHLITTKAKS